MKLIFFVQGEGRGHMSQALTLKEKLESRGHEISRVFIGAKNKEDLPAFFKSAFTCPIEILNSPGFKVDKKNQGIMIAKSVFSSFLHSLRYLRSVNKIKKIIKNYEPDALISFYEPLVGAYLRLYRDKRPTFFIGHQYFMDHPAFNSFFKTLVVKKVFKIYNLFTAPTKNIKIALSFSEEKDLPKKNLFVCPPLIRKEVKGLSQDENFYLLYLLNHGYSERIISWSNSNPGIRIEAFRKQSGEEEKKISQDLSFHNLNGEKFLAFLKNCKAYISTAGFDSIAEAAYLGKRIMMVPTKNHFEQEHNAIDAERAKIALKAKDFDLSLINNCSQEKFSGLEKYKSWHDKNEDKIIELIENFGSKKIK
ncbi:hypothetical protein JXK06_03130 [Patescibacteria group bacterium]|nr:hypothetical protein [Patescibacteria group bacterium]